jgi:hypothetical protein
MNGAHTRRLGLGALMLGAAWFLAAEEPVPEGEKMKTAGVDWVVDNLQKIGGHEAKVEGAPKVVETDKGPAVSFDGRKDAILLETNPVEGLRAFSVEVLFRPAAGGAEEQRFFHLQEEVGENRLLLETRMPQPDLWYGDTFLKSGKNQKALNDPKATHPAAQWHTLALVYDGTEMTQYVDGKKELSGKAAFPPMKKGRASLGARMNLVSWFKGEIRRVRITPRALAAEELLRP